MKVPTIHRNGTGKGELLQGYLLAANALRTALKALQNCSPNGRDYYPQGDRSIHEASEEHCVRHDRVLKTLREVERLAAAVNDGGAK